MYSGGVLLFLGGPILLGSVYGLLLGLVLIAVLVVRIFGEERMLRHELAGYNDYVNHVKWRLIPFVF
jgi:protein-S-isoprenylcysteine O-methyltransferase Ste14